MFSPLANMARKIPDGGRWNYRGSDIVGVMVHHQAGVDLQGEATNPAREVSAAYWITNVGDTLPQIPEELRAWTSGHPNYPAGAEADHRFITVEVSNSGGAPGWPISRAARVALARLIGDVHARYGLGPVKRGTARGVAVHSDFVATECPGPSMMAQLDEIISWAEEYRVNGATAPERDKDKPVDYITLDTNARKTRQSLKQGEASMLALTDAGSTAMTSKPGDYQLAPEVRVKGEPGAVVRLTARRYVWDNAAKKYSSNVYLTETDLVVGPNGFGNATFPIANRVGKAGERIGVVAKAVSGGPVSFERVAVKGHRWDL